MAYGAPGTPVRSGRSTEYDLFARITRRLRGFVLKERGIPRHGYDLANSGGEIIGRVTSGTMSPVLNLGIGMGYVAREYAAFGTEIFVQIRNKAIPAEIVKVPFI